MSGRTDEAAPAEGAASPPETLDILLVDDRPEDLLALEAILADLGQNLVKAHSGREALRQVLAHDFAVILLDVQMPEMDGYETAALIRERPTSRHVPIIFLTATHKAELQMLRGYTVGAVDYLFKPIDAEVLRSKVSVFVDLARQSVQIERQTRELIRKELEARQLAQTQALLAELEQRNHDLEGLNKELEAFSYSVSHDLRAPLRSIDGFSQTLLEDCAAQLNEQGQEHLHRVRAAAQHMGSMIDGLLALARVTRGELRREPLDLSRMAREVVADLARGEPPPGRQVSVAIEDGLTAQGDPRLLGSVLENLLGNAWKFTRRCAQARIEFGRACHNGHPAFFVRDNGAGFDMAYADRLFGVFQRLHLAADFEGHGVGLATVERIVRRHGGRIWAEGQVDAGATFHFTLNEEEPPP